MCDCTSLIVFTAELLLCSCVSKCNVFMCGFVCEILYVFVYVFVYAESSAFYKPLETNMADPVQSMYYNYEYG